MRSELEAQISDYAYKFSKGEKVPIIVIVVGGGPNTVDTCLNAVKTGSPCVFVDVSKFL